MIIHLDPERIKESEERRWKRELYDFLKSLPEAEFELAQKLVKIITHRPPKKTEPCEVSQFVEGGVK